MKKVILSVFTLMLFSCVHAQKNVTFEINHKLGTSTYQSNTQATNNLGDDFTSRRLEYYVSQIKLTYDGGKDTTLSDRYILANANTKTSVALGAFPITNLESVSFGIGVDASENNNDPALWPSEHPLAPKSPSMHWGWTAGYRFVAFEGNCGPNLASNVEIHALDNANYFTQAITTTGESDGNDLKIRLDADYTAALKDISLATGAIEHGSTGIALSLLANFQTEVFSVSAPDTVSGPPAGLNAVSAESQFVVVNPIQIDKGLQLVNNTNGSFEYRFFDLSGKQMLSGSVSSNLVGEQLDVTPGVYTLQISNDRGFFQSEKVILQ